ncbi:MAG TPA: PIG-L family deacetylase [Bacteroidia bacterium]|jgi:LmbE family N-acetylglucosaminyl deacetylase|nr:PIG-L family deacetylase [Bacteroidia bacterium]
MNRILSLFLCAACILPFSYRAQTNPSTTPGDILSGLEKLEVVGSVLYIAAHPDDENTRLLAYLASEKKVRTAYLSLTRGDGGQNLIGKEQGDALGLIRTQELLAARRMDGAEQFFTRANDFGYSKNPEETFSIWNKDSILADVVWAIRRFRPDVIICRFPTTGEGGHGHHTASAILAKEAFDAAADPNRFPWQLKYAPVWQARRLFWNTFNFGGTNTTAPDQLKIDVGTYNPLLGKGYGEIAAESRSNHKSQGFGSSKSRGSQIEYFKQLKGDTAKTDLFDKIDLTWKRLSSANADNIVTPILQTEEVQLLIATCQKKFDPRNPALILPELVALYRLLDKDYKGASFWTELKLKETETLILSCAGIWVEATASDYSAVPGYPLSITTQIIKRNACDAKLRQISYWVGPDTVQTAILKTNEQYTYKYTRPLPSNLEWSCPYWLREKHDVSAFVIPNPILIGKPENDASLTVQVQLNVAGLDLEVDRPVIYKSTDPVKGEVYRPLEILPPATVNIAEKMYVFCDAGLRTIDLTIHANADNVAGTLELKAPEGWTIVLKNPEFKLDKKGDETVLQASISPTQTGKDGRLSASLKINSATFSKSIRRIEYDHIPYQFILTDPESGLVNVNLKKTGTTIAYIPGAGDDIPACLKQIGYSVTILTDDMLKNDNLSKYQAILTGVRAYNTSERLPLYYAKLMQYVQNGGNLIVQYNTNSRIGPVLAKIGPYPFTITRDRVTDEKAEITILQPQHAAFNIPNKIGASDFEGWVQERGIYFAGEMDSHYKALLSMHDPGEKPSEGSLIVTPYGKGNFVYSGLVFFRELPAGIPGAYRLLVNLLSLPPNK